MMQKVQDSQCTPVIQGAAGAIYNFRNDYNQRNND